MKSLIFAIAVTLSAFEIVICMDLDEFGVPGIVPAIANGTVSEQIPYMVKVLGTCWNNI